MNIIQAIILGIIQGMTEFIPVSSSAHLVIAPYLFGWQIPQKSAFIFDVIVQDGTLVAVIAFFWRDFISIIYAMLKGIWVRQPFTDPLARKGWYIIVATIPAGIVGLLIKDQIEAFFSNPLATGCFLILTALFLFMAEYLGKRNRTEGNLTLMDAIIMGIFQAISIFPGISRSGSTITGGMVRNLNRYTAARFSFLMSVPILLAAGLLAFIDLLRIPNLKDELTVNFIGFLFAAIVGYFSIRWLLRFLTKQPLTYFSIYCVLLGIVVIGVYFYKTSSQVTISSPLSPPTTIRVVVSPDIHPIQSILTACDEAQSELTAFSFESSFLSGKDLQADLAVAYQPAGFSPAFITQIGKDQIILISNPANRIKRLTHNNLLDLYLGKIINWQSLTGTSTAVSFWTYPEGNPIRQKFEQVVLEGSKNFTPAFLAPDPGKMLSAVSEDAGAIGYIPKSWLVDMVNTITLDKVLDDNLVLPVFTTLKNEPKDAIGLFLSCVQTQTSQLYNSQDD